MVLSLRWRFLGWFFVNLLVVAVAVFGFLRVQFRFGINSLLAGPTGDRLEAIARPLATELRRVPEAQWADALDRAVAPWRTQGLRAALFRSDATPVVGDFQALPTEVRQALESLTRRRRGPGGRPPPPPGPPPPSEGGNHPAQGGPPAPRSPPGEPGMAQAGAPHVGPPPGEPGGPGSVSNDENVPTGAPSAPPPGMEKFLLAAGTSPRLYWAGVHLDPGPPGLPNPGSGPPRPPVTLLLASDSLRGGGLFFDYAPWLALGGGLVLLSVTLWLPFVSRLTRALGGMTRTAERIAEGRFDVPAVSSGARRDELGRLSRALGHMATRLEGFVTGQKRFLGDTAHELLSPLGRLEVSLSILEQRAAPADRQMTERALGEVRHLAGLVGDLLLFTKSELRAAPVALRRVPLLELAREVAAREGTGAEVRIAVPPDLAALADADLLNRALSNAVRNAVRYAGAAGPITVSAVPAPDDPAGAVLLTVADEGPGAPENALHRLFDPFFRPEAARTRETGGTGLGLAIVKSCVEACGGQVTARNRTVAGLALVFRLRRAPGRVDA